MPRDGDRPGFVCAGVLLPLIGTRAMFVSAGVGVFAVWCAAALLLRARGAPAAAAVGAGS